MLTRYGSPICRVLDRAEWRIVFAEVRGRELTRRIDTRRRRRAAGVCVGCGRSIEGCARAGQEFATGQTP